jgi:hypothetical protein
VYVAIHELRVLLDIRITPGWFHVRIVNFNGPIHEELLSIVIPLRSSHPSSLDQQVVPTSQLAVERLGLRELTNDSHYA